MRGRRREKSSPAVIVPAPLQSRHGQWLELQETYDSIRLAETATDVKRAEAKLKSLRLAREMLDAQDEQKRVEDLEQALAAVREQLAQAHSAAGGIEPPLLHVALAALDPEDQN